MIIGKTFHIDAAHYLQHYAGKCARVHGHTWKVTVEVRRGYLDDGMVMDLHKLSDIVHKVIDKFDHQTINLFFPSDVRPTCENLASIIAADVTQLLPPGIEIHQVKVQEGEGGYAICIG